MSIVKDSVVAKHPLKNVYLYLVTIILTSLLLVMVLKLWNADLRIPFMYSGDGITVQVSIKAIIDNGWLGNNPFLGAPHGLVSYDYPVTDVLVVIFIKFFSLFTHSVGLIINLLYLASFILASVSALYVFLEFGMSSIISITLSILFSFLPYHFWRGEGHFFLSFYFQIPFLLMMALWIMDGKFHVSGSLKNIVNEVLHSRYYIISIIACISISYLAIYYAFFACFFLLVAGIAAFTKQRDWRSLVVSGVFITIISIGVLIEIAPSFFYTMSNGQNTFAAIRNPGESEVYGLKIIQLLLPLSGHRLGFFSAIKNHYNSIAPLLNENDSVTLGIIGSFGFISLLFTALFCLFSRREELTRPKQLSLLNIAGVLLATIGGFGTIFAFIVSPEIRAYNRIVPYISFLSLFSFGILFDWIFSKVGNTPRIQWIKIAMPLCLLLAGVLDQTSTGSVPNYEAIKGEFLNDKEFVSSIENSVPPNTQIFQLPYVPYPENPPVNKMVDYDLLRGYMHSGSLKWSYGAMRGRQGDIWYKRTANMPVEDMLRTISLSDFSGIYIDRFGYADQADSLIQSIQELTNSDAKYSNDGRLVFIPLGAYNKMLAESYSLEEYQNVKDEALNPITELWKDGFYELEGNREENWRWCSEDGLLVINNTSTKVKRIKISMNLQTVYPEYSDMVISSPDFRDTMKISNISKIFSKALDCPSGEYSIKFKCNAKRVDAPGDPRYLVFKINNYINSFDNVSQKETIQVSTTEKQISMAASLSEIWKDGFSELEGNREENWRWCSENGRLILNNTSKKTCKVKIAMSLESAYPELSDIVITSPDFNETVKINNTRKVYSKILDCPPGEYAIKFQCNAKRVNAPGDPRFLVFKVNNYKRTDF